MASTTNPYRSLPRVDALLSHATVAALDIGDGLRLEVCRAAIDAARVRIGAGEAPGGVDRIAAEAAQMARERTRPTIERVLNATGVIVHTNLGRAPVDVEMATRAMRYCSLEYDLEAGKRGSRRLHAQRLLTALSGAEAAMVVNNNAAAVYLALAALCKGREVIISRGELVEIGGSFRVPDILAEGGATLVEVGTTNRTWARDYAAAITENTAAIMRVHPSNFRITGFTHRPATEELVGIARERGVLLISDLGSGTFAPLPSTVPVEEDPRAELAAGVDLVCFSGDKLLGGPQAGLVLGSRACVDRMARHPMARALRADKIQLALLESTLLAIRTGAYDQIPVLRMLRTTEEALRDRAARLTARLAAGVPGAGLETLPVADAIGGGSHPDETIPGIAIALSAPGVSANRLAERLRAGDPGVVALTSEGRTLFHMRTIAEDELDLLATAIVAACSPPQA